MSPTVVLPSSIVPFLTITTSAYSSRHYFPIWKQLKDHHTVSITASRPLHARIIKAVKKEKWQDMSYKLQIEPRRATLSHSRSNSILTFTLSFTPAPEDF